METGVLTAARRLGLRHARAWLAASAWLLGAAGCATPVGLSILGGGTSAMVSHNLNGSASRTFTASMPAVRNAAIRALETMGVAIDRHESDGEADPVHATAGDRAIRIEFERLGDNLTLMSATASRSEFLRDTATAKEVVAQTAQALEASRAIAGASPHAARRTKAVPARPPVPAGSTDMGYILVLESVPAGKARRHKPMPASLQQYVLYTSESGPKDKRMVQLNLGYFDSEAQAGAARKALRSSYPRARVVRVVPERDVPRGADTAAVHAGPALAGEPAL